MYSVVIVEDEILERENTCLSWVWKTGEFDLIADFSNGEDAWRFLQENQVDIVVTDIRMPFMDGLALCEMLNLNYPSIKIIILSGYNEFIYAQKALKYGVSEYIVKPIRSQDLYEALQKVATILARENEKRSELASYKKELIKSLEYRRQNFYTNLVMGLYSPDKVVEIANEIDVLAYDTEVCCAIIEFYDEKIIIGEHEYLHILDAKAAIYDALDSNFTEQFNWDLRRFCLIFKSMSKKDVDKKVQRICVALSELVSSTNVNNMPFIAVGRQRKGVLGIVESFADTRNILNFRFLFDSKSIVFYDDDLIVTNKSSVDLIIANIKTTINNLLNYGNISDVDTQVDKIVKEASETKRSFMLIQYISLEVIKEVNDFLVNLKRASHVSSSTGCSEPEEIEININLLNSISDLDEFVQSISKIIKACIVRRDKQKNGHYENLVDSAKRFIEENYSNPELSLKIVANQVNISQNYLSTLFAQEAGASFIEYLTNIRMSKAQELLKKSDMRITEIAFAVGYQDSNYFSKIFRRLTGNTPSFLRKNFD